MIRATVCLTLASIVCTAATPVAAESRKTSGTSLSPSTIAPSVSESSADADAPWMQDDGPARQRNGRMLNILYGSYGVLQGFDMYSTIVARNAGAREVNPLMDAGYPQAAAQKAAMSAVTYFTMRAVGKKNRKAAIITMAVLNTVTAAVVVNNMNNTRR